MSRTRIYYSNIIPFKGYIAINLFGIIFIRREYQVQMEHDGMKYCRVINHELIHTAQMRELWYIGFYLLYIWYWFTLSAKTENAYSKIPFEVEAHAHESDFRYLMHRKKFAYRYEKD